MLNATQLQQIMPRLPASKLAQLLPHLGSAMSEYGINSAARASAFLAQLAHESGEFRWMEEIWGPTTAQRRYEPVSELAKRLGNSQPGDGYRFKGRGPIQLTGRANYQRFGKLLGIDLVAQPELAAKPEVAFRIAALYWSSRGLNELADREDFREITRRINGGFNGLADRIKYFDRARAALASWVSTRSAAPAPATRSVPAEPLSRGFEAIRELAGPGRAKPAAAKTAGRRKSGARPPAKRTTARKPAVRKKATKKKATKKKVTKKTVAKKKVAKKKVTRSAARASRRR
jgi:putative chitinase